MVVNVECQWPDFHSCVMVIKAKILTYRKHIVKDLGVVNHHTDKLLPNGSGKKVFVLFHAYKFSIDLSLLQNCENQKNFKWTNIKLNKYKFTLILSPSHIPHFSEWLHHSLIKLTKPVSSFTLLPSVTCPINMSPTEPTSNHISSSSDSTPWIYLDLNSFLSTSLSSGQHSLSPVLLNVSLLK